MRLSVKTPQRITFELIHRQGVWHKKFIIFPRVHRKSHGRTDLIFFEFVYRKAIWGLVYNLKTCKPQLTVDKWLYNTEDNVVYETLAKGDELSFVDSEAEDVYNNLRTNVNEQ